IKRGSWQLRGELKTKSQLLVATHYGFSGKSPEDIAGIISRLQKGSLFHFKDIEARKGPFGNPLIPKLFAQQWLTTKRAEGAGVYSSQFKPAPPDTVALICTSIECSLDGWKNGILAGSGVAFAQEAYEDRFEEHLETLKRFRAKNSKKYKSTMNEIWEEAW
ncbi:hypothetical protein FA95DRAFT_1506674, partial [Auriscalpium vulgare]